MDSSLLNEIRDMVREALNDYLEIQMLDIRERIEERGDPLVAIGLAGPSSLVKSWTSLNVDHDYTTIHIKIGFITHTNEYDEVFMSLSNGLDTTPLN
jgi:hypothetical protein